MTKNQELATLEGFSRRLGKDSLLGPFIYSILLALGDTIAGENARENLRELSAMIREKSFDF